ncbi:hypothetical protein E8E14_008023 [Neopestalotiopsis sp. 37M]|nr:hypothetical protein E8E14_008023 [Neopestalotiopsis sp. 37M]
MEVSTDQEDFLLLSEDEKRVLELYDRLQQLQLEIALITAQKNYIPSSSQSQSVEEAQNDLLESRARYVLRDQVTESVVMTNPVLQAVHGGTNASPIEKDLLGVLTKRDSASIALADQTTSVKQINEDIMDVRSRTLQLSRQNVDLAAQVLDLAGEAEKRKAAAIEDTEQAEQIAQLEQEVKASRQRWRVMKATASAIVAGSGVDWAGDEQLRSIVLDEDEDGV